MKRHRSLHRVVWFVLPPALLLAVVWAWTHRSEMPVVEQLPIDTTKSEGR